MSRAQWFQMWVALAEVTVAVAVVSAAVFFGGRSHSRRRRSQS